jgi:hypothetical protein
VVFLFRRIDNRKKIILHVYIFLLAAKMKDKDIYNEITIQRILNKLNKSTPAWHFLTVSDQQFAKCYVEINSALQLIIFDKQGLEKEISRIWNAPNKSEELLQYRCNLAQKIYGECTHNSLGSGKIKHSFNSYTPLTVSDVRNDIEFCGVLK